MDYERMLMGVGALQSGFQLTGHVHPLPLADSLCEYDQFMVAIEKGPEPQCEDRAMLSLVLPGHKREFAMCLWHGIGIAGHMAQWTMRKAARGKN